jgi:hypothetical protein
VADKDANVGCVTVRPLFQTAFTFRFVGRQAIGPRPVLERASRGRRLQVLLKRFVRRELCLARGTQMRPQTNNRKERRWKAARELNLETLATYIGRLPSSYSTEQGSYITNQSSYRWC